MRGNNYTVSEDDFIREVFQEISDEEIADKLGRTVSSVTRRRQRLGLWHTQVEAGPPLPNEKWATLPELPEPYAVSNCGRVRGGRKLMTLFVNRRGYAQVRLSNPAKGLSVSTRVHRLVGEAFVPKPPQWTEGWHVHHRDHNPLNNRADNLVWLSPAEHRELHRP